MVEDGGSRASSLGPGRLAASEQVANRPIVHHVLAALKAAGATEIIVATPCRLAGKIRECLAAATGHTVPIQYVEQPGPMDVAAALRLAAPMIGRAPCIFHPAAGLLGESLETITASPRAQAPDVTVIVDHGRSSDRQAAGECEQRLNVTELEPRCVSLNSAAVCLFGPDAVMHAASASPRAGGDFDAAAMMARIREAGGELHRHRACCWRRYSGDALDLLDLNRIALDRLPAGLEPLGTGGTRIEGRVEIHEQAMVRSSVIVGPGLIGPGAQIVDAYIGPYTSIGAGARVEGAEIERSIVGAGASIIHVGGRLVASVVGRNARVFRDFSLPRAMRLRLGEGNVVGLC